MYTSVCSNYEIQRTLGIALCPDLSCRTHKTRRFIGVSLLLSAAARTEPVCGFGVTVPQQRRFGRAGTARCGLVPPNTLGIP